MYIYICKHINIYIHTFKQIYTYTHTHTHAHAHTLVYSTYYMYIYNIYIIKKLQKYCNVIHSIGFLTNA